MKDRIEILLAKVAKAMQEQLAKKHYGPATNISPVLERVHRLQNKYADFEHELLELESTVARMDAGANGHDVISRSTPPVRSGAGRAEPTTLRITIDWKANKRNQEKEKISLPMATESMTEFVARMVEELGERALQTLSRLRINRGPLLSRSPERDFGAYQYKQLRGTEYYLLTHSSTPEKVDVLREICRALGLTPGSVQIEVLKRSELSEGFVA